MIQRRQHTQTVGEDTQPKWFNSPVTFHKGTLTDIRAHIPAFERRGFGLSQSGDERSRVNDRLDTIVRLPFGEDNTFIPVGVVSKDYALVTHAAVFDSAAQALAAVKIAPADVTAELKITEYGERMALSLYLPDKYCFDPGDGNPMALRFECLNSVEGSSRLRIQMSWNRLVCGNGRIVGITVGVWRRHIGELGLSDIIEVLKTGLEQSKKDMETLRLWRRKTMPDDLAPWIESTVLKAWGFKAAVRTWHIARTGSDVEMTGPYKGNTPTTIAVRELKQVPGAPTECRNLFDASQILAWLAKERRDVQEQLDWRAQIPELMKPLLN